MSTTIMDMVVGTILGMVITDMETTTMEVATTIIITTTLTALITEAEKVVPPLPAPRVGSKDQEKMFLHAM